MFDKVRANEELWELFTKQEEYAPPLLDQYQRFPYYLSKYRGIFEPKVSTFLVQNGFKVNFPENHKFAVCLTHDIDIVRFPIMTIASEVFQTLSQGRLVKSLKMTVNNSFKLLLSPIIKRCNPAWNFVEIMNLESKYGAKSTFFFLLADRGKGDFRAKFEGYRVEGVRREIKAIVDAGWEVGLHGGHRAYIDVKEMRRDKDRLEDVVGKEVLGYRNHFLRFKVPTTWELLKEAGFKYDTTFGYADCVGFRNGMCHPFRPFNLDTKQYIDIWEIPLTIMDGTLGGYMKLDTQASWDITKRLIDTVEANEGVITILWHNHSMIGEMGQFYERILEYCYGRHAWMTSAEEIWQQMQGGH